MALLVLRPMLKRHHQMNADLATQARPVQAGV